MSAVETLEFYALVHTDARDDNFLLTADGTALLCDWNWPALGPVWGDAVHLLISAYGDGLDADAFLASHPLTRDADPDHVHTGMKVRLTTMPVGTDAAVDLVIAGVAIERIGRRTTDERIVSASAENHVIPAAAGDGVGAARPFTVGDDHPVGPEAHVPVEICGNECRDHLVVHEQNLLLASGRHGHGHQPRRPLARQAAQQGRLTRRRLHRPRACAAGRSNT